MVLRAAFASSFVLVAIAACTGKDPYNPGTQLGTFHVVGKLTTNTCDATGGVPDPWEFDVKLARDRSTLYWIQGGPPVQGTLDSKSHTSMTSSDTQTLESNDAGVATCALTRDDVLDATLLADPDDSAAVLAAVGTLSYSFSQRSDTDCSDQLTISGGGFETLPCSVSYVITAKRTALPK
jgi:hypothetical protein